jgi:DNA-directed RNA polymerase subunit RPC12/RpoP
MTVQFAPEMRVFCEHCGFERDTGLDDKAAEMQAQEPRPVVSLNITHVGEVHARARELYYNGHDYLFRGDKDAALRSFERALELQEDFVDAHLWIAKTTDDEAVKRDHLDTILAHHPGHMEAVRMFMVLQGRLTPEEAERTYHFNEPQTLQAAAPVGTTTTALHCPTCGGDLTVNEEAGTVECRFCGYTARKPRESAGGGDILVAALLERKAQAAKWVIGERLLHCNNCGAERTIAGDTLSTRCPFCGSNHVIVQDALGSFEQPDGILPFYITREEAGAAVKQELKGFGERLKGMFLKNKVARATLDGFYLPFWVFDAIIQGTRTRIDNSPEYDRYRNYERVMAAHQQTRFNDALYDIEVCAVASPPRHLTAQLGDYDVSLTAAYEPELLAKYPAGLYTMDFDKAALEARSIASVVMRGRYTRREINDDSNVTITVFSNIQSMSFRLLLLPVWVATLVEEDGDIRPALVNGQSGKVVLGKAQKPA